MAVILLTYYLYKDFVCFEIEGRMSRYYEFTFFFQNANICLLILMFLIKYENKSLCFHYYDSCYSQKVSQEWKLLLDKSSN